MNTNENVICFFRNRLLEYNRRCRIERPTAFIVEGMVDDEIAKLRNFLAGRGSIGEIRAFRKNWEDYLGPCVVLLEREINRRIEAGDTMHGEPCEWDGTILASFKRHAPNWLRGNSHLTKVSDNVFALWGVAVPARLDGVKRVVQSLHDFFNEGTASIGDDGYAVLIKVNR